MDPAAQEKEEASAPRQDEGAATTPHPQPQLPLDFPYIPIGHPDTMMSKESVRKAVEEFIVRPTDIIVATFSKTGTTLVTWICHLLRTNGGEDFDFTSIETLYEVIPWPLLCWDIGYCPNTGRGNDYQPRIFKSHLRMSSIYRGCKYIVTVRDPAKTTISFYNFLLAKKVPIVLELEEKHDKQDGDSGDSGGGGGVSSFLLETPFVKGRPGRASLWEFYAEYHLLKDCDSVLIVIYEDLVKNMKEWIPIIAQFMGLNNNNNSIKEGGDNDGTATTTTTTTISPELINRVIEKSTKEYMAQYMTLFDEPYERAKELGRCGDLSQLAPGAKVAVKEHTQKLNKDANQFLKDQWDETMKPLGYENYTSFCSDIRQRNEKRFGMKLS